MRFCQFRDIFGAPGTGLHSIRLFNIAIVDVIATILAAWMIAYYTRYRFVWVLGALFVLGIFFHWVFCVDTTINKLLFGRND